METNTRKYLAISLVVAAAFVAINFHSIRRSIPTVKQQTFTLSRNPKYDYRSSKGGTHYWIEIYFKDRPSIPFQISGFDYQYLNHPKFIREIKEDSQITITYHDDWIIQLAKSGDDYMNPIASANHSMQNQKIANFIFTVAFGFCALPLLFRNRLANTVLYATTATFIFSLIAVFCLTILAANYVIGEKYSSADWTLFPVEKRRS